MSDLEARLDALEARTRTLEDQIQIYQLMSAYGPLVDSGDAEATAALWVEDGVYDWGSGAPPDSAAPVKEGPEGAARGRAAIAAMVRGPYHQAIIQGGAGHVIGMPHVMIEGDRATAVSYSRLYRHDGENFRVWRVAANLWEFARMAEGWRVTARTNRVLDGSEAARRLLRAGLPGEWRPAEIPGGSGKTL
jgi:hypothetical protein